MYFSAEHLALANQAVRETFGQCSIAWQAIPHWDTRDPGQISVANGLLGTPGFLTVLTQQQPFDLTIAQAIAPTPDALLTGVIAATKDLAKAVDGNVLPSLFANAAPPVITTAVTPQKLEDALITARATVEDAGYRAPSSLITNTVGLQNLGQMVTGSSILGPLLNAGHVDSLYRFQPLDGSPQTKLRVIFLGRRRRIPQGAAPEASPGEEPVDIAVSLPPSLEVDGETSTGKIQLTVRIRFAARITDATGLVAIQN